jgi:hypothetical protein
VSRPIRTAFHGVISWLVERRLVIGLGLAASVPIIASMIERMTVGWVPLADNAVIAVRSLDVLTAHSPLVGQWSSGPSQVLGDDVYTPGPLLYWLLALPARLPGAIWLEVTMGLVNVASVIGVVGLAWRRGGWPLMFVVAVAMPVMLASLPPESLSDIWNPSVPLLPFTLLIFLAWSLACGEHRLLPLTVLVASFTAQGHLSYVPPTVGALAVGLAGLALRRRRVERGWVLASLVVAVVCWIAPLLEQATHRPGNLIRLGRAATADDPTLGLEIGLRAVVRAVGIPPWWLRDPQVPIERVADLGTAPSVLAQVSAIAFLAALLAAAFARRRLPRDVRIAAILALVLCAALVFVAASTPRASFTGAGYTLRWAAPEGMWVWLVLGLSLAKLLWTGRRLPTVPRPRLGTATGLAIVAAIGVLVALSRDPREEPYSAMRTIADRLERIDLPENATTRVEASSTGQASFMALGLMGGIVYTFRREGKPVTAPAISEAFGSEYDDTSGESEQVLHVAVDNPPPGGKVIARLAVKESPEDVVGHRVPPTRSVTVTYAGPRASAGR